MPEETHEEDEDLEAAGRRPDGYQPLAPDAVSITYFPLPPSHRTIITHVSRRDLHLAMRAA